MIAEPSREKRAQLAASLVKQLQAFDNLIRQSKQQYRGDPARAGAAVTLHGLVLQHGVGRFGARLPKGMRKLADKLCFSHATDLMIQDIDRFIYCEGYAIRASLGVVFGTHAWVLDRENGWSVIDNTWRNPVEGIYMGIPFTAEFVFKTVLRKDTYGIIDNYEEGFPIRTADPAEFLHPLAAEIPRDFTSA